MRDQSSVHTVVRALRMLGSFEPDRSELAVRDFAQLLRVHKSTASRLAATLTAHGFLQRVPGADTYRLGPEAARVGLLAIGGRALADAAQPVLNALAAETGEMVVLSVAAGGEALDVAQAGPSYRVGASTWIGRRTPLHASSDGKVLLAWGAAELPRRPLVALAPGTITRRDELERQLEEARARGFALAVGDYEEGLNGVAAPVLDAGGDCVAALSVSGPDYRMPVSRLAELGPRCRAAAGAVGARLAGTREAA